MTRGKMTMTKRYGVSVRRSLAEIVESMPGVQFMSEGCGSDEFLFETREQRDSAVARLRTASASTFDLTPGGGICSKQPPQADEDLARRVTLALVNEIEGPWMKDKKIMAALRKVALRVIKEGR